MLHVFLKYISDNSQFDPNTDVYTENSTCPFMCQPHKEDMCNGNVMPIYIKYDGTVDYRETQLYPQRNNCSKTLPPTTTPIPSTIKPSNVDQDWILVIIFTIGTIAVLAFVVYFLIHIFKRYKNQPGSGMRRFTNSFRGRRPSWFNRTRKTEGSIVQSDINTRTGKK